MTGAEGWLYVEVEPQILGLSPQIIKLSVSSTDLSSKIGMPQSTPIEASGVVFLTMIFQYFHGGSCEIMFVLFGNCRRFSIAVLAVIQKGLD